jgi:hypothetical protein
VATRRPFPFAEHSPNPRKAAAPLASSRDAAVGESSPVRPPVLARIPDVTLGPRRPESHAPADPHEKSAIRYRFDTSHVASKCASKQSGSSRFVSRRRRKSTSSLDQLSASIRYGAKAWEILQTYPSVLRAVAMFVLTAAAGTSMMLMMDRHPAASEVSPAAPPAAASIEPAVMEKPTSTHTATESQNEPASDESLVPTATGPGGSVSHPLEAPGALASDASSPAAEPKVSLSISPPSSPRGKHSLARGPSKRVASAADYPTTPYPVATVPSLDHESIPQAQMTDPAPAVARLSGDILDPQDH